MSNHGTSTSTFSCCLIGGNTLLTQCGELLLEAGHSIELLITDATALRSWARAHQISVVSTQSDYVTTLAAIEYDYLFAITHLAIIPAAAIDTPKVGAINFHDGPLPEFAGLNSPMWALIRGASEYAISWHEMAVGIDTGDVLLREPVAIADDDTAVSLNTKCFTAALDSFPRLLQQLVNKTVAPVSQNLAERTYFARADRPANHCVLDWGQSAQDLERLIRALNTGRYENTIGLPKILIGEHAYIVETAFERADLPPAKCGEVIEISDEFIIVGTGSGALALAGILNIHGEPAQINSLSVKVGDNLTHTNPADDEEAQEIAKAEHFWVKRLSAADVVALPYRSATGTALAGDATQQRSINVPQSLSSADPELIAGAWVTFLARVTCNEQIDLAVAGGKLSDRAYAQAPLLAPYGMAQIHVDLTMQVAQAIAKAGKSSQSVLAKAPWLKDLVARQPALRKNQLFAADAPVPLAMVFGAPPSAPRAELTLHVTESNASHFEFMPSAYSDKAIDQLVQHFENWLTAISQASDEARGCDLDLLSDTQRTRLLVELNDTALKYDQTALMQSGFEALAKQTPDAVAIVADGKSISYAELNDRAHALAVRLQEMGAAPDKLVGVYVARSIDLMVATLGVLKSGAAYVPLDPAFPADRIAFMIEDSAMPIVVTQSSLQGELPACDATLLNVDELTFDSTTTSDQISKANANNLAYVIYTSGSTGQPKGVMLEHMNVVNFFHAMDQAIPGIDREDRTWLAVTSLSFDISVLELFWTLNRGFKVAIYDESSSRSADAEPTRPTRVLDMSLFMWGNDDAAGPDKYKLLIEGAKFFDTHGFSGVWTPERHFHAFGGPYPNPAVTGAAVATITNNIKIRAGSCVVPLHHPVRIAEEWAVVDNLSNGRVEIAAASGWNPNDFVLRPEAHENNKQVMFDQLEQVRALWRGEKLTFPGPLGDVELESLPRPVQKELPCWITTAGSPETWQQAGRLGLNVLTHLLGQSVEEIASKVKMYRAARKEAGYDPETGCVAVMLHTFVGADVDEVRELVREPMKDYLSSSMKLAMDYAWSFPAFKRPGGDVAKPEDVDLKSLNDEEVDTILNFAFERYFEDSGLFGDEDRCLRMLARCAEAGVDEIACLMDFGVATDALLNSLPDLNNVREQMVACAAAAQGDSSTPMTFADYVEQEGVTHLQCTPSTARMYLADSDARAALGQIDHLLLGGEALPATLAQEIKDLGANTLTNMYGPTETTIWSLTSDIDNTEQGISIGTPIANTQVYVLDNYGKPLPAGIPGELFIGGDGVARGYLNRAELTKERFVEDPFANRPGARMYATGDLACFRDDGVLDYLGRTDFQVKVRGYRIELGEIESRLEALTAIDEAAVIVRTEDAGDQRLVAYVTQHSGDPLDVADLRTELRQSLPEYMVPNEFVTIESMPRTANGKLDRKVLTEIKPSVARQISDDVVPTNETEQTVAEMWRRVLKVDTVGLNENFFDLGGHSLLVVQLHGQLKTALDRPVSLTDLYQYTTIKSLSEFLTSGADNRNVKASVSRGEQRRAMRRRRA